MSCVFVYSVSLCVYRFCFVLGLPVPHVNLTNYQIHILFRLHSKCVLFVSLRSLSHYLS